MLDLNDLLPAAGADLTGWTLNQVRGMSQDGRVVIGSGIHNFGSEAWIAILPPFCGSSDFDCDGDVGTDADIESFFRVLGGGSC